MLQVRFLLCVQTNQNIYMKNQGKSDRQVHDADRNAMIGVAGLIITVVLCILVDFLKR